MDRGNYIIKLDQLLFELINHDSQHFLWDDLMLLVRNPASWIPLYIFLTIFFIRKAPRQAWQFILFSFLTFTVTDSLCSQLKEIFERLRPCADTQMMLYTRNVIDCGGLYSFPSNHATNHFGLATFWYVVIDKTFGNRWKWFWGWAALICYAQVYVGKHYPLDVSVGAVLGIFTGWAMARLFLFFRNRGLWDCSLGDALKTLSFSTGRATTIPD